MMEPGDELNQPFLFYEKRDSVKAAGHIHDTHDEGAARRLGQVKWLSGPGSNNKQHLHPLRWMIFGMGIMFVGVTIILSIVNHQQFQDVLDSHQRWEDCGGSPEEARSRGCTFELMTFGWQTKECHNAELAADFASLGWTWWTDMNQTAEVPEDIVLRGDTNYYVLQRYHVLHCVYTLQMMHQGWERGYIEHDIIGTEHTKHCVELMTDEALPWDMVGTQAHVYYPKCMKV